MKLSLRAGLRQVLPRPSYAAIAVIVLLSIELTWAFVVQLDGPNLFSDKLLLVRDSIVVGLLTVYGVYRVLRFHPLLQSDYLHWLKATPWRRGLPLPIGPVHPTVADAVVVLALAALLADARVLTFVPASRPSVITGIMTCVFSYATTLTKMIWFTRPRQLAYLAGFLLAASVQLMTWLPPAALVSLLTAWLVAQVGLSLSWENFPWDHTVNWGSRVKRRWKQMQSQSGALLDDDPSPDRVPPSELGWPFGALSPWMPPASLSRAEQMLIAAMFGWWMHAVMVHITNKELLEGTGTLCLGFGTFMLAIRHIIRFGENHASPLSFGGRLLTLRWIIPGYDRIWVAPFAILVVTASLGFSGHYWMRIPLAILIPVVAVCALWIDLWIGPSPEKWKLTAPVRIVHGPQVKKNCDQLT